MGLVGAQEVSLLDVSDGHATLGRMIVQLAPHVVQVHHPGVLSVLRHLVDLLEPLHFAVAEERITSDEKLRQWT